jgi:hypothetical protein
VAGFVAWAVITGFGNGLWAVRVAVTEPGSWLIRWPHLYWDPFLSSGESGTPIESMPSAQLDDLAFWIPGVVGLGAFLVACLLVAGWIARAEPDARVKVPTGS